MPEQLRDGSVAAQTELVMPSGARSGHRIAEADRIRFVRITYQECVESEWPGEFVGLGIEQDIRLRSGYFQIGDDHDPEPLKYEIIAGRLQRRAVITRDNLEVLPES